MRRNQWRKLGGIMLFLAMAAFALSGCSGSDGATGATGPQGPEGPEGPAGQEVIAFDASNVAYLSKATYSGTITSITAGAIPVVEFRIVDGKGVGVEGLEKPVGTSKNLNNVRFTVAKLVPGTNGSPSQWMSYFIPFPTTTGHEKVAANLTPLGNGNYRYTFKTDLTKVEGITYEPTLTHRLGIRFSGSIPGTTTQMKNSIAFVRDFIPTGGGIINQREITTKAACLECHVTFEGRSGGHLAYADPKMCVLCHTDQWRIGQTESTITGTAITPPAGKLDTDIVRGEALLNFINMIHKAHMGTQLTLKGYAHNNGRWLPNDMVYPQDIINCRKCHKESAATPQGDNWRNKPSRQACGSCHDGINFATGTGTTVKGATTGHAFGIPQTNDASCSICHTALDIDAIYHVTANATPNNPNVPAGAVNFIYEISTVTVNESRQPVVKFRIKSYTGTDATTAQPVTFNNAAAATLLTGFTSSPSFLVTYADPTESWYRSPWQKQEDGTWKQIKDPNDKGGDNNQFYEDKFALIWTINSSIKNFETLGCFTACHAGENSDVKPFGNKYTASEGELGDIWHWKSIRNAGQIDDQYLDSTKFDAEEAKEAGRKSDPKEAGGYADNFASKPDPNDSTKTVADKTKPGFTSPAVDLTTGAPGYILGSEKVALTQADLDALPVGTLIPGIVKSPFVGDRGDISAGWEWKDGVWTIELGRKLVTAGEFDVQFSDLTAQYYFGMAIFENAQVRHAFQQGVSFLVFQPKP